MSLAYLRIIAGGLDRVTTASRPANSSRLSSERLGELASSSANAGDSLVSFRSSAITNWQQAHTMLPDMLQKAKQHSPGEIHAGLNSQRALELLVL